MIITPLYSFTSYTKRQISCSLYRHYPCSFSLFPLSCCLTGVPIGFFLVAFVGKTISTNLCRLHIYFVSWQVPLFPHILNLPWEWHNCESSILLCYWKQHDTCFLSRIGRIEAVTILIYQAIDWRPFLTKSKQNSRSSTKQKKTKPNLALDISCDPKSSLGHCPQHRALQNRSSTA